MPIKEKKSNCNFAAWHQPNIQEIRYLVSTMILNQLVIYFIILFNFLKFI